MTNVPPLGLHVQKKLLPPAGLSRDKTLERKLVHRGPETLKTAVKADAPGTGTTETEFSIASFTKRYPGSDMPGVPASETSAISLPPFNFSTESRGHLLFIMFVIAHHWRIYAVVIKDFLVLRVSSAAISFYLFQDPYRAKGYVFHVAYRGCHYEKRFPRYLLSKDRAESAVITTAKAAIAATSRERGNSGPSLPGEVRSTCLNASTP